MKESNQTTEIKGQAFEIQDLDKHKWTGQELGVSSGIPLVDEGKGKPYIVRQFQFNFNPVILKQLKDKKIQPPSKQELFNYHWRQIEALLWGDGLIPCKEVEPRMIVGRKKYKIILLCEPSLRVMVAERPQTLQQIVPPQVLTGK